VRPALGGELAARDPVWTGTGGDVTESRFSFGWPWRPLGAEEWGFVRGDRNARALRCRIAVGHARPSLKKG